MLKNNQKDPEIPENTRHTRKYPKYPEIPEIKKGTQKYPIIYFNTPTWPEPDPLPGILSNTRPDPILKNPTRWALVRSEEEAFHVSFRIWAATSGPPSPPRYI